MMNGFLNDFKWVFKMKISFVIGSLNEGENLKKTIRNLQANTTETEDYEIIVADDASTDGSSDFISEVQDRRVHLYKTKERLGSANSKNFGAEKAQGELLCFLDAHVLFPRGWLKPLMEQLEKEKVGIVAPALSSWHNPQVKGYGMRWRNARLDMAWLTRQRSHPYPVPMVGLACMAFRRAFFEKIGGFDRGLRSYGTTDQEICLRSWLLGYEVVMVPEVTVAHYFRSKFPYPVSWVNTVYNKLRTVHTYFNPDRQKRSLAALKSMPRFQEAYKLFRKKSIADRRNRFLEMCQYSDDWFFEKFAMKI
jgi:GT2 family glycosyltransferase